ncbi:MAG: response regulator, partial [Deltaproteobacteria bacterium]|nr:response regulator [Deltaproteobacteria bacterium]
IREEVLGVTSEDLNLWVDAGSLEVVRKTLIEKGIINNLEVRFRMKDGSITNSFFSARLFEMNGEYYTLSVSRDISELKEAQKEQSRLETQLQQVQKMESIGTLAGGIAHNFNYFLMSIQGKMSVMLYTLNENDALYDQLKNVDQLIQSGSKVTNQLLRFARKSKLDVKPEDLNKLIKNSSKMFAATKKEIKVHRKYQKNVWAVEIDKNKIDQMLLNLFVNASQAMPKGGDFYIETENVMLDESYVKPYLIKPGKFVKISVTDTGTGMDETTRQKIFDPFFTTKDVGKGTGLGLASAYGIIKNHKGIINVYSEMGVGSTFNIYLPVTDKKVIDDIKPQEKIIKGSETILIIDDEQRIIDAGNEMLEILGYKVLLAASGKKAIEIYRKKNKIIDLVILDMILPEMNGSEIYDRLKDINSNVKVLLSSGFTQNGQATEILDKGCNGFIQKPFTLEQLSHKISEVLSKK